MFVAAVQKKREKLDTRAWIFFSSLSNACYAGYVYLVLIYFVYICFFFFALLSLHYLIIHLSLFLKKMSSTGQNDHSLPGACLKNIDLALCLFVYLFIYFLYKKELAIDILRAKSLGLLLAPVHTEIA